MNSQTSWVQPESMGCTVGNMGANYLIYTDDICVFGPKPVVLKLYKHTERLRSFPSFCRTPFWPNLTESKNGLHVSDDLFRTPEMAPSNLVGSIEPSLTTAAPDH